MRSQKLETPDPVPPHPACPSRVRTPLLIGLASVTLTACASAPSATGTRLGEYRDGSEIEAVWSHTTSSVRAYDTPVCCLSDELTHRPMSASQRRVSDREATTRIVNWLISGGATGEDDPFVTAVHDENVFPPLMPRDTIAEAAASWFDASVVSATTGRSGPFGFRGPSLNESTPLLAGGPRTALGDGTYMREHSVQSGVRTAPGLDAGVELVRGNATLTTIPGGLRTFRSLMYLSAGLFLLAVLLVPAGCAVGSSRVCPQPRGPPGSRVRGRKGVGGRSR